MFCQACCWASHQFLIYHRIEKWNSRFFQDSRLWEVGVRLHVGHQGLECPSQTILLDACKGNEQNKDEQDQLSAAQYSYSLAPFQCEQPQPAPVFIPDLPDPNPNQTAEANNQDDLNWEDVPSSSFAWVRLQTPTPICNDYDNEFLLIVDSTGLLSLPVVLCSCLNVNFYWTWTFCLRAMQI